MAKHKTISIGRSGIVLFLDQELFIYQSGAVRPFYGWTVPFCLPKSRNRESGEVP